MLPPTLRSATAVHSTRPRHRWADSLARWMRRARAAAGPAATPSRLEPLEPRQMMAADLIISEFMASNNNSIEDGDGAASDWVELYNQGDEPADLLGWSLTDNPASLSKWTFPSITLSPGQFLVVFASGQESDDYIDPSGNLHTNFKLSAEGDFLALVKPDGVTIASQFTPQFPPQAVDISYGVPMTSQETDLIGAAAPVQALIPTDGSLGLSWTLPGFTPTGWITESAPGVPATTGVGFDNQPLTPNLAASWPFDDAAGSTVIDDASGNGHNGSIVGTVALSQQGVGPATGDAFSFSGAGNIDIPFSGETNPASFTFAAWARVTGGTGHRSLVTSRYDGLVHGGGNLDGFIIYVTPTNTWEFWTGDGESAVDTWDVLAGPAVQTNVWTHLAITFNQATQVKNLYVNGVLAATTSVQAYSPVTNTGRPLHIGSGGDFGTDFRFTGLIDDVGLWNAALSAAEINNIRTNGIAEGSAVDFNPLIATNLTAAMQGVNASAYLRLPFNLTEPASFDTLSLLMKYDDGFVAYLNGVEIARRNAPAGAPAFSAAATGVREEEEALIDLELDITAHMHLLEVGENVLAIHGLNSAAADDDFLIAPRLVGRSVDVIEGEIGYFNSPTPGAPNPSTTDELGAFITEVTHLPLEPLANQPMTITALITPVLHPVVSATLRYRVMYGSEVALPMFDDGLHGDGEAGDSVYGATIPAGVGAAGQMLRWYISTTDAGANGSRAPLVTDLVGQDQSEQYFGTVIANPAVTSALPIFQWFTTSTTAAHTRTGVRGSVYYNGEFYDNIFIRLRGGFTNTNSQKFDFNSRHKFYINETLGRVEEINLNAQGSDPAYIRQPLAFQSFQAMGAESSEAFMTLMRVNGGADRVGIVIEQVDQDFLQRNGLDPDGALYKFVQRSQLTPALSNVTDGVEKKTRLEEDFSDLQAVVNGLALPTPAQRTQYVLDNFNIPQMINYLAARAITQDVDSVRKNFYMYRDSNGSQEWNLFPWDKDWTFGVVGGAGGFSAHPFLGDQAHKLQGSDQWSVLFDVLYNLPTTREMYLRRIRTLMDEFLQPASTPLAERYFEARVDEVFAPADPHLDSSVTTAVASVKSFFNTRRNDLYVTHSIDNAAQLTTLIPEFTSGARWFVPTNDTLGLNWTQRLFSDVAWGTGSTGVGYENAPSTYQSLIQTRVKPTETVGGSTSFFVRIPFNVPNIADVTNLTLRMKYDDGFVAYLNGVEVARRNIGGAAGTLVAFNALATNRPNASAAVFEDINIAAFTGSLLNGNNVLAIHGINTGTTSSDMLILPMLVEGTAGNADAAGIPHEQIGNPLITVASVEFNPASGNQDQEYIQFTNPNATAVDISGWHVAGAVDHTFAAGTVIPAGGSLYLTPDSKAFRARTTGPRGGQGLFVQGGFDGHLSNFGETIELYGSNNVLVSSHTYTGDPTDQQEQLRITEVNYNPSEPTEDEITAGFTDNDQFEFIELRNISGVLPLSLLDVEFVSGVSFNFTGSAITMLAPGERVLIVADSAAFTARYGAGLPIAGQYTGSLSNDGETIKIEDSTNSTVAEFSYSDSGEWPGRADGNGSTLHVIDIDGDYNAAGNWRSSGLYNGSPGAEDVLTLDVIINEVLTHTDLPQRDSIELYNTTGSAIDLSGWWISDSKNYTKFQIPNGVMIDAHGYLLFDEEDFNPTPETPAANHFSFDGAHGEEAHLLRGAIGNSVPLSFADGAEFDAALNGISFGRVPDGDPTGELFPNITPTPNAANSAPKFGPLMIAEVMYHAPGEDNDLEYIELYNSSRFAIDLTNWRLAGAADFDFAPGTIIGPRQSLVILGFDPLEPLNADKIAAFELAYSVTIDGDFIGPFLGNLADEGERVKLQQPDEEPLDEPGFIPHPLHDEVKYDDAAPWSLTADGLGDSLHRYTPKNYGHTATSWRGQPPTPGRARGDINGDDVVSSSDIDMLFDNAGSASPLNDLTTDGNTDNLDIDLLVQDILCTFYGDADLNQQVSIGDLTVLAEHFGEVGTASWSTGDFNGDDSVSIGDLTRLAENFGSANPLTGDDDAENGDATPAGLQALGDGTAANSDDDEDDDDALIDILADLGNDLR